ncbi:hypothetical protein RI367_008061 [Sorochytrium milnesiophthora]
MSSPSPPQQPHNDDAPDKNELVRTATPPFMLESWVQISRDDTFTPPPHLIQQVMQQQQQQAAVDAAQLPSPVKLPFLPGRVVLDLATDDERIPLIESTASSIVVPVVTEEKGQESDEASSLAATVTPPLSVAGDVEVLSSTNTSPVVLERHSRSRVPRDREQSIVSDDSNSHFSATKSEPAVGEREDMAQPLFSSTPDLAAAAEVSGEAKRIGQRRHSSAHRMMTLVSPASPQIFPTALVNTSSSIIAAPAASMPPLPPPMTSAPASPNTSPKTTFITDDPSQLSLGTRSIVDTQQQPASPVIAPLRTNSPILQQTQGSMAELFASSLHHHFSGGAASASAKPSLREVDASIKTEPPLPLPEALTEALTEPQAEDDGTPQQSRPSSPLSMTSSVASFLISNELITYKDLHLGNWSSPASSVIESASDVGDGPRAPEVSLEQTQQEEAATPQDPLFRRNKPRRSKPRTHTDARRRVSALAASDDTVAAGTAASAGVKRKKKGDGASKRRWFRFLSTGDERYAFRLPKDGLSLLPYLSAGVLLAGVSFAAGYWCGRSRSSLATATAATAATVANATSAAVFAQPTTSALSLSGGGGVPAASPVAALAQSLTNTVEAILFGASPLNTVLDVTLSRLPISTLVAAVSETLLPTAAVASSSDYQLLNIQGMTTTVLDHLLP